ncbi:methyltransferase domain-containing protein [Opitutus terrae]|uniref:Arsenite methyltransferase n=1 Tax=Opitutus terrae (strain DSM 11246 / JCM 15787 / PB90-1) TaxID=452637 RepID=B1ZQB1_OPITP|nr:methyltransferase domain-containing protein [Opitutus terrae]ACB73591.1 Methyltransferase type 11 [Opitutus terrae PB90-1]
MPTEHAVKQRYAAAAKAPEAALCCPVDYDRRYLEIIPAEVIEKDYGCGDPSRYVKPGETVLDLGSGTGKICFIAAQVVGPQGRVIGVDMTDEMLEVARRNAPVVAERLGYANVEFRKGRIQDLALDLEQLDRELARRPISDATSFLAAQDLADELRVRAPLVADGTIDVVVSNCVLNLVEPRAKRTLFEQISRVLRRGGRAVISDIVADEPVPDALQQNPELWSGCISGALTEEEFLQAFADAGFHGIQMLKRDTAPWRTVEGIEFRSVTVQAFKGKQGPCLERNQAVVYLGPFKEVLDDDGHRLVRGRRHAVCDKTYRLYQQEPYRTHFAAIDPLHEVPLTDAKPFDCAGARLRHPRETKGQDYDATTTAAQSRAGGCC